MVLLTLTFVDSLKLVRQCHWVRVEGFINTLSSKANKKALKIYWSFGLGTPLLQKTLLFNAHKQTVHYVSPQICATDKMDWMVFWWNISLAYIQKVMNRNRSLETLDFASVLHLCSSFPLPKMWTKSVETSVKEK